MSNKSNEHTEPDASGKTPGLEPAETLSTPDAAALTLAQIEALMAKAAKADDHWDRLLRQTADFDNYKKRAARERQEGIKYANESLLEKLVPVMDNFDMALAAASQPQTGSAESLKAGVGMIATQFKAALTESGLEEIDALGKPFDPNWHEAVSQQESAEVPEGQVVQQLRKGYKLRDRLLRPSMVIISKKPAA
jgi:molecular chaperone GrpE